ncbi:aldo/keto reductase [Leifsonia sp. fls2-241-R2A-40a]|uniref:aldo/keto reductase n=1 Tax=Leifsonia sp. fls2-241-R2A-40a TaxID=3040290 RepID=UPI00254B9C2B|nr:aldo/keto reductase [Leifsonia sp. fls2-241-R2A-40a]
MTVLTHLAGKPVRRVGYGAMQLGDVHRLSMSHADAVAFLRDVLDRGVNHIDTAEFYAAGAINRAIGDAIRGRTEDVVVATKIGAVHDPDAHLRPTQKPEELRENVEANLQQLGLDRIDLVYLRRLDVAPGIAASGDQLVPLEDQLAELAALRDEGKLAAIGLSHVSRDQVEAAIPIGLAAVQNAHSLVDASSEPVLELVRAESIAWAPYFPLGGAFPGMPKVTEQDAVISAASQVGVTPSQLGLAWLLGQYEGTLLIPGTKNADHLAENIAAGELVLPPEVMEALRPVADAARAAER